MKFITYDQPMLQMNRKYPKYGNCDNRNDWNDLNHTEIAFIAQFGEQIFILFLATSKSNDYT